MIDIYSGRDLYRFDPETQRIFKNDVFLSRTSAEPVYSNTGKDDVPIFSGIYLPSTGEIITKTGHVKKVVDINSIK